MREGSLDGSTDSAVVGGTTPSSDAIDHPPSDLEGWLDPRAQRVARRRLAEVTARDGRWEPEVVETLGGFHLLITRILARCLGPEPGRFDALWEATAELYGSFGAMRGLAAGEILEEFQLLKETLIRALFREPPGADGLELGLRETLHLSRVLGRGVTHAGVGHTDALFFSLFQGSGVAQALTPGVLSEVRDQLAVLGEELGATPPGGRRS